MKRMVTKRKSKNIIFIFIFIFIVLVFFCWALSQFKNEKDIFFSVTLYELIGLFITIVIACLGVIITIDVTEKNTDTRRVTDLVDLEISKIQELLYSDELRLSNYTVKTKNKQILMSKISRLNNKINFLKKCCKNKISPKLLNSIDESLTKYNNVQDYLYSIETVRENSTMLVQCLDDIDQYLLSIRIELFIK